MRKALSVLTGLTSAGVLLTGALILGAASSAALETRAIAAPLSPPFCEGFPCGPCGSKCVCNEPTQICLDNTQND